MRRNEFEMKKYPYRKLNDRDIYANAKVEGNTFKSRKTEL